MNRRAVIVSLVLLATFVLNVTTTAQETDSACPVMVENAIATVGDLCAGLGRNQVCYGNTEVMALDWHDALLPDFTTPGDMTPIDQLASLTTMPLDLESDIWGIAMLAVQADLPETLPGQNVVFVVYGDATLQNAVSPDEQAAPLPTCAGQANGGANLRTGTGTTYAIAGGLAGGDAITANGRNAAGDWLRLVAETPTWVFAALVTLECDVDTLEVVEAEASGIQYTMPMQAFRLTTGVGQAGCADAPRDGLLVQAPTDTTVHFLINGIEIRVGSTAVLDVDADALRASTLAGTVSVTSAGQTQTVEPGYQVVAMADVPPTEPEPYDYETIRYAPVTLLPEQVNAPITLAGTAYWLDTGIFIQAGQTFTISASGQINGVRQCHANIAQGIFPPDFNCEDQTIHGPVGHPHGATPNSQNVVDDLNVFAFPMADVPIGGLVGRVGDEGDVFYIATGGTFVAANSGTLQLSFNTPSPQDNDGAYIVEVNPAG